MSSRAKGLPDISWFRKLSVSFVMTVVTILLLQPCPALSEDHASLIEPNRSFVLSEQEAQFIKSLAPLRVMIDDNFVPLSSYDTKTRSYNGLSVQLFRHVAGRIGLKYQLLHDPKLSWSNKVELFNRQEIDLLMPVSFTEERARAGIFTTSFYDSYYGTIVKKSSNIRIKHTHDLALYKVGVTKASAIIPFMQSTFPGLHITYYENQKDLYQGVRNGEIDVALQNRNVFQDDRYNLRFVDLMMPYTIVEYPRKYSYYLIGTEPFRKLAAIIDRYLAGAEYSRLVSHYDHDEDDLIQRYNEQKNEKKLLEFGVVGTIVLLVLLFLVYLNHRRFSAKLAATLEQVQLQQVKLQRSEEKYRGLFDDSRDALIILEPPSWKFASGNQAAVDMFWVNNEEEFLSRGPLMFSPARQPDGTVSSEKSREMIEIALRDGYHLFEWTHRRISGEEFPAEVLLTRFEEEGKVMLQATIRDITGRRRSEEALREQKKQLRDIIDFLPDATLAIDKEKRVIIWNHAIEEMSGVPASEMIGKGDYVYTIPFYGEARPQLMDLVFEDSEEIAARYRNITRTGDTVTAEVFCNALYNNKGAWLFLKASPLKDQSGNVIGAIESIRDITGRKHAEDEKRELEQQLYRAQKLESLGVLAGGIAHDFNNILTVILGHCYIAREVPDAEHDFKATFQQIETAGNRAADLCRQMLTYAGNGPMIQTRFSLWLLVDEVIKMLQAAIKKNVSFELDLTQRIPEIKGDSSQIQQVVMNLIINAAEAIGEGIGTIRVVLTKEVIEADTKETDLFGTTIKGGVYACLEVTDTGCGMDDEIKRRIFEPFFTTKFTGRGLGMSAIHGIIKTHEGMLQMTSTLGVGTTFKVYLPVPDASVSVETSPTPAARSVNGGGTILLVEDEQMLRIMGSVLMEALGFSAIIAQHGREALEIYHELGSKIDLVLIDLVMPVMGGLETYHCLREINPNIPIIICSGYNAESVEEVIEKDKYSCFTRKPYNPEELRDMMLKMMNEPPYPDPFR